jgi:hypothetical protein
MRYVKLGILSYSNEKEYIGNILKIDNENFKLICNKMNKNLIKDFKKCKNEFIYALEKKYDKINDKHDIKVIICYNYFNKWEFELITNIRNCKSDLFKVDKDYILA